MKLLGVAAPGSRGEPSHDVISTAVGLVGWLCVVRLVP